MIPPVRTVLSHVVSALLVAALAAPGCGLVLDVDPPDPQRVDGGGMDAGVDPEQDAAVIDAGAMDAEARSDASDPADATTPADALVAIDARVVVDATIAVDATTLRCRTSSDCAEREYCARPRGTCYGEGDCVPIPTGCPDVVDPVCGCDWEAYGNPCEAATRGSNVMQGGACPLRMFGTEWCSLSPMAAPHPAGCARCFDDGDCGGLAPICVGSSCRPGGEGLCALGPPPAGDCYDGRQCRDTEHCVGSAIDVCLPLQGVCDEP
jgi:hypothetical protein